jgi:hypothetical protein
MGHIMNIQNMAVRGARDHKQIDMEHIEGELNPADLLSKEHGSIEKFLSLCDMTAPLVTTALHSPPGSWGSCLCLRMELHFLTFFLNF